MRHNNGWISLLFLTRQETMQLKPVVYWKTLELSSTDGQIESNVMWDQNTQSHLLFLSLWNYHAHCIIEVVNAKSSYLALFSYLFSRKTQKSFPINCFVAKTETTLTHSAGPSLATPPAIWSRARRNAYNEKFEIYGNPAQNSRHIRHHFDSAHTIVSEWFRVHFSFNFPFHRVCSHCTDHASGINYHYSFLFKTIINIFFFFFTLFTPFRASSIVHCEVVNCTWMRRWVHRTPYIAHSLSKPIIVLSPS